MTIFGLDSAGKTAGIAILRDSRLIYECYLATGHTHSETLLCLCKNAFDAAGLSPAEIDVFAAAAGPGSFTGLRIGLAAVKGLAFPHDTPCAAVSTLEALAYSAAVEGTLLCALDARRGEVYWAGFFAADGAVAVSYTHLGRPRFGQKCPPRPRPAPRTHSPARNNNVLPSPSLTRPAPAKTARCGAAPRTNGRWNTNS